VARPPRRAAVSLPHCSPNQAVCELMGWQELKSSRQASLVKLAHHVGRLGENRSLKRVWESPESAGTQRMCLEPMASLAREAMTALQVPAATESAAATRRVVGSALKAATRRSFQQGARSTSEKTEVLRWVQRQPAAGMAEYLKPHLSGKYHAGREEKTRMLVGTAELRLHTRGHRADVPGEDLLCRCCPARVREGPFHFAFGCQDRADLVRRLRAALGTPPAKSVRSSSG